MTSRTHVETNSIYMVGEMKDRLLILQITTEIVDNAPCDELLRGPRDIQVKPLPVSSS